MIIYMQPRGMTAVRNCNHLHLGLNGYHFSYDIFGQHIRQKSVKQHNRVGRRRIVLLLMTVKKKIQSTIKFEYYLT